MHPKDAYWMANTVDPDGTAPLVWTAPRGSTLFAKTCLYKNLGHYSM